MRAGNKDEGGASDYGEQALLAVRSRFFLAYRLSVRLVPFALPGGGLHAGWWPLALAGFLSVDVGQWLALRNPTRFGLRSRLLLDSCDIAFWSFAPFPAGAAPIWVGLPLAMEAGFRRRFAGLMVPAVVLAVVVVAHLVVGPPLMVLQQLVSGVSFTWLLVAVGWGILLRRYVGKLQRRTDEECQVRRSAEYRRAFLAGQNSLAMGSSSVVDAIEATLPLLGPPEPGSVLWTFADAWKTKLAESTAGCAAYLGQVVAEWAAAFNTHPDLASRIQLSFAEGIGTTIVTPGQAATLQRLLSRLNLMGEVLVDLAEPGIGERPPGQAIRLQVNETMVELPADPGRPPRPYDPAPLAFFIAAGLMITDLLGLPLHPFGAVPGLVLSLAAIWWADRLLRHRGLAARGPIIVAAGVIAIVHTIAATLSLLHPTKAGGVENYPILAGLDLLALLGGMYWRTLSRTARASLMGSAALVVVSCFVAHGPPNDVVQLLVFTTSSIPLLVVGLRLDRELDTRARLYAQQVMADDRDVDTKVFEQGRRLVLDLVSVAVTEARVRVNATASTLSPEDAKILRHRLEEVDRRLDSLMLSTGLSSSTTTS